MKHFFISYNHGDRGWAEWIAWQLEEAGYTTILQAWDFRPGGNFAVDMQQALAEAERTIAVLSPHYIQSGFSTSEWAAAFGRDPMGRHGKLLPVRVQECDPVGLLPQIVFIDLVGQGEAGAKAALLSGIKSGRAKPGVAPGFPGASRSVAAQPAFPGNQAPVGPEVWGQVWTESEGGAEARSGGRLQVALLYKRNAPHAEHLTKLLEGHLTAQGYDVFIDRQMHPGLEWAREIRRQVCSSEAVIPLLSPESIWSEMLEEEIQTAHKAAQQQGGKPRILPVRVNFTGALPEPLSAILDPIQYTLWEGPQHDERLLTELTTALVNPPVVQAELTPVGGGEPPDSKFYIQRLADDEFKTAIARQDSIVLVKGARQMGKTSLLARGLQQAREAQARVVLTDLQALNETQLASADVFFLALATEIAAQLGLEVPPKKTWDPDLGANMNMEWFLRRHVLKAPEPVVWGLDEVDRLFSSSFGNEVFGLFRAWHNRRSLDPSGPFSRLTLAIAYATEAHLFITDLNQSPFNVGTRLKLDDFALEQVTELNRRHGSPLRSPEEIRRFYQLVSGQPYLVRRGLAEMVNHKLDIAALEAQADRDEGVFGDHLRRILVSLSKDPQLTAVVRGLLRNEPCSTPEHFFRLRSAGVIAGDSAATARPRCKVYATYLARHLF
jgi:hypothetical protein